MNSLERCVTSHFISDMNRKHLVREGNEEREKEHNRQIEIKQ